MARKFLEESFSSHIRSLIGNVTHDAQYYNITPYVDGVGTSHVSVLAEDGSAVSVTSSINHMWVSPEAGGGGGYDIQATYLMVFTHSFGSAVYSPRTGIILNNQLSDFCGQVSEINHGNNLQPWL